MINNLKDKEIIEMSDCFVAGNGDCNRCKRKNFCNQIENLTNALLHKQADTIEKLWYMYDEDQAIKRKLESKILALQERGKR